MKCCICNQVIKGFGNNPSPFKGEACCDACNLELVIPARILFSKLPNKATALLIKEHSLEVVGPSNGKCFTLKELQNYVEGYIQTTSSYIPGYLIICNEEGLPKGLYPNIYAYPLARHRFVGNVLLCPLELLEEPEYDDDEEEVEGDA